MKLTKEEKKQANTLLCQVALLQTLFWDKLRELETAVDRDLSSFTDYENVTLKNIQAGDADEK